MSNNFRDLTGLENYQTILYAIIQLWTHQMLKCIGSDWIGIVQNHPQLDIRI